MSSGSSPRATNDKKKTKNKGEEEIRVILVINHKGTGAGDHKTGR